MARFFRADFFCRMQNQRNFYPLTSSIKHNFFRFHAIFGKKWATLRYRVQTVNVFICSEKLPQKLKVFWSVSRLHHSLLLGSASSLNKIRNNGGGVGGVITSRSQKVNSVISEAINATFMNFGLFGGKGHTKRLKTP